MRKEPVIHVDLDNPRISKTEGEPVFLPQGGNSRYLERIAAILHGIHKGLAVSKAMFAAFTAHGSDRAGEGGDQDRVPRSSTTCMATTLSAKRSLRGLDGESLVRLNSAGFLQGAFLVIASLNNMKKLIDMKHQSTAPVSCRDCSSHGCTSQRKVRVLEG